MLFEFGQTAPSFGLWARAAAVATAAACFAAPSPPAAAQDAAEERSAEAGEEDESFGKAVSRAFSKAWSRSTDWLDPDQDVADMCVTMASPEPLEENALKTFSAKVREAWDPPAPTPRAIDQAIALEVCLGPESRSLRRPRLLRPVGALEPEQSVALLAALSAVEAAAPFEDPQGEYAPWRRVVILFDTHRGVGAATIGAQTLESIDEPGDIRAGGEADAEAAETDALTESDGETTE
ncbi:MAG: hypothetical protein AAGM38_13070 [Pseudomonadota bacterium]